MAWQDEEKEKMKDRGEGKWFSTQEGTNNIRFCPNKLDKKGKPLKRPFREYNVHWNVGPDSKKVTCGRALDGSGDCYICSKLEKLEESGNEAKKKRAWNMRRTEMIAFQVCYSYEDSTKLKGPVVWDLRKGKSGDALDAKVLPFIYDKKKYIYDAKKGYILHFERIGKGKKKTTYVKFDLDEEPTEIPEKLLKQMKTFDELVYDYDEKYAQAAWFGKEYKRDEEDEDDDEPKKKKKGRKDEDDDDEDTEDEDSDSSEEEDEDEDDDEPKKKTKKKKSKSEDEDEDDDEETDDDESEDDSESEDDEDVDEDDGRKKKSRKNSKKSSGTRSKKRSKDDDEDEDEDGEEDSDLGEDADEDEESDDDSDDVDDDDDVDDKPKSKKKSKKRKEDDDDGDEEEDSEEEDEDEEVDDKPRNKPKKKPAKRGRK